MNMNMNMNIHLNGADIESKKQDMISRDLFQAIQLRLRL